MMRGLTASGIFGWQDGAQRRDNGSIKRVMSDIKVQIDFNAPATLRKWPSLNNERASHARWPHPYVLIDGTLDECIRQFMEKPIAQHHLYEIHTAPQGELVSAVLSAIRIIEIARLTLHPDSRDVHLTVLLSSFISPRPSPM
jgi:hypothetical protein